MTETLQTIQSVYFDELRLEIPVSEMPPEAREAIVTKLARQVGSITEAELELALAEGWQYGSGLINGFKPDESILTDMARRICGIPSDRTIDTNHFVPVMDALDQSARVAKRTLHADHHTAATSEESLTSV